MNRVHFDTVISALQKLQTQSADILAARSALSAVFDDDVYKLDGTAYNKRLTKQFNGIFSRLFNAEYKHLITDLRLCKKDGKKPSYTEAVTMTERLSYYQQKNLEFIEAEAPIKAFLGEAYHGIETEWDYVTEQMSALEAILSTNVAFGELEQHNSFSSDRSIFADYHQRLGTAFAACSADVLKRVDGYFDRAILDIHATPCIMVLSKLTDCLNELDKLDNWCHFRNLLSKLDDKQVIPYVNTAISQNINHKYIVGIFQKQFYYQWIDSILYGNHVLSSFNRISQDKAICIF